MSVVKLGLSLSRCRILSSKISQFTNVSKNVRLISTTEKSKDSIVIRPTLKKDSLIYEEPELTDRGFSKINPKNWVSFGPSDESIEEDRTYAHILFFCLVTLGMGCTVFFYMYMPDYQLRDWTKREAFLELRRREGLGLAKIDGDLVPLERIHLPSDEELKNVQIYV